MYTLQNIKDTYYTELALGYTKVKGLEDYIKDNFVRVYDQDLDFMGYERQC